jgi:serine/threonine-protein kinase
MFKKFMKLMFYFLSFIVLSIVAVMLVVKLIDSGRTVEVPSLVGMSVSSAEELLNEKGLYLEIAGREYNGEIPEGHIISQSKVQGENAEKGERVAVFVSKGRAMYTVPYLEGMNINDVKLTLEKSGLEIGRLIRVHSYSMERDIVIAQRPLPGFSEDNKVNLLVSAGLYEVSYKCPSFKDMTMDEARKVAMALGLKLVETGKGNVVVFQKPEAGSVIKRGDTVEVRLGRGWGIWF